LEYLDIGEHIAIDLRRPPTYRRVGDITILPLAKFLERLWGGAFR
jgi:hypothetical protein